MRIQIKRKLLDERVGSPPSSEIIASGIGDETYQHYVRRGNNGCAGQGRSGVLQKPSGRDGRSVVHLDVVKWTFNIEMAKCQMDFRGRIYLNGPLAVVVIDVGTRVVGRC